MKHITSPPSFDVFLSCVPSCCVAGFSELLNSVYPERSDVVISVSFGGSEFLSKSPTHIHHTKRKNRCPGMTVWTPARLNFMEKEMSEWGKLCFRKSLHVWLAQ